METLDSNEESFAGEMVRAVLWGTVFLEILIIYGVRS
jgi:hypothetical protein